MKLNTKFVVHSCYFLYTVSQKRTKFETV